MPSSVCHNSCDQTHNLRDHGLILPAGQRAAELLEWVLVMLDGNRQLEVGILEEGLPLLLRALDADVVAVCGLRDLHIDHRPLVKIEVVGSGKGSPEYWVAVVKPGRVMFEIAGVPEDVAREALRLASHKLPIKTKVVKREDTETQEVGE